jgi:HSP20 family protein
MSIQRWEPFPELMSLRQAMDRLFEDSFIRPSRLTTLVEAGVPVDMYQTPDEVVVKVAAPGLKPGDIDINISGDVLTIKGETKAEKEVKQEDYLYQEWRYGGFTRSVTLPGGLRSDKTEANLENGVLTVTIPKAEEVKPKVIKVKAKEAIEGKKA